MVLLDSEGIDAVMGEGLDTRHDLSGLEYPSPRTSDFRGGKISGIEKFKVLLKRTLTPKHSFNDGELVTGEGKGYYCIFVWLSSPVREQLVTSLRFLCIFQTKITGFEDKFRGISLISRILSRRLLLELWESQSYAMLFYFRLFFTPFVYCILF